MKGQVGCSTAVRETPSHTKEPKQRHRRGKRKSARIKEIVIFSLLVLFCCDAFKRKHFLDTTGLLFKRFAGEIMELLGVDGGHQVH